MKQKTVLTTEDIKSMSLKDFMAFRQDRGEVISFAELCEANSDWLLISDLEAVTSLEKLRKLTNQLKEDLWWNIHHGRNKQNEQTN